MSAQPKYLDFELKIDDLGGGRYRATVTDMPLGEGQAEVSNEFTLPFAEDDLNRSLAVLSGAGNVSAAGRVRQARLFGEALFKAVFGGPIYPVYFSSLDRARSSAGLRIRLVLENAGAIATLPWEFLRDPAVDYLALSRSTPLVRHPSRFVMRPRPALKRPLRVLVMVSAPSDLPPVDVQTEWQNLLAATARLRSSGALEMELLEDASLHTLQQVLRTRDYHVFHYIGHSTFDQGVGMLALEDPFGENKVFPVSGEDLARELSEENAIRLVVLNSCESAVEQQSDPFAGIASSLVARGIPAVIAMQFPIGEQAAQAFSEELYRAVADGLPVDAAMADARRAVNSTVGGIEWATPVLYMRTPDGILFAPTPEGLIRQRLRKPAVLAGIAGGILLIAALLAGGLWTQWGHGNKTPTPVPSFDLAVEGVEVIPSRPIPGQKAAIIMHVVNNSQSPVGAFDYDFRQNVLDPTPSYSDKFKGILAPGDSTDIFIPHVFTWWGEYVSEVRVDVNNQIPETNKFNNIEASPILTDLAPFVITLKDLPGGEQIDESMPVSATAFSDWGFRLEAVPTTAPGCAGAVPWIIVEEGGIRYLGTGLPDTPAACADAGLAIVLERGAVGGVSVQFQVPQEAQYSLAVFDENGEEEDRSVETFAPGNRKLELTGSFPSRLSVARAVFEGAAGVPTHMTQLSLFPRVGS